MKHNHKHCFNCSKSIRNTFINLCDECFNDIVNREWDILENYEVKTRERLDFCMACTTPTKLFYRLQSRDKNEKLIDVCWQCMDALTVE